MGESRSVFLFTEECFFARRYVGRRRNRFKMQFGSPARARKVSIGNRTTNKKDQCTLSTYLEEKGNEYDTQ